MVTPQALTPEQIQQIIAAGRGSTVNIGGTLYGGNWADIGDGEARQEGPLQSIYGSTGVDQAGQPYYEYSPTGAFVRQGVTNKSQSFFGGLADAFKDPVVLAALGGAAYGGLLGGGGLAAADAAAAGTAGAGDVWAAEMAGAAPASEVAAATAAANAASTGLTASQLANLAKAGISVAGLIGGANAISNAGNKAGGTTTAAGVSIPTQGAPEYTADYYSRLQGAYNQAMPGMPRDVVSNLASWYGSGGGMPVAQDTSVTSGLFGKELAATKHKTTPVNLGSAGYQWATNQGGQTPMQFLNNINQWILDNPNATADQIKAEKAKYGISDVDVQTALGQSTFSDATKYALTHNMGLSDVNKSIVNWLEANPAATNEQIQQAQSSVGVSDADIARALAGTDYSPAAQWNVINDVGLNEMYQNIANAAANTAANGYTPEQAVAAMKQYGISPEDLKTAYSMFNPTNALSLSDVLAAYK